MSYSRYRRVLLLTAASIAIILIALAVALPASTRPAFTTSPAQVVTTPGPPVGEAGNPKGQTTAEQEDRGDVKHVSWWLKPSARMMGAGRELVWAVVMWLNLIALLAILWKVLFKGAGWSLPAAMHERSQLIRRQIDEAVKGHEEANRRLASVEARLARLQDDIASIRDNALGEAEAEYQRILEDARSEAARLAERGRNEVEVLAKAARQDLKQFAANLAIDVAEKRIRERLTPELDRELVESAGQRLVSGGNGARR